MIFIKDAEVINFHSEKLCHFNSCIHQSENFVLISIYEVHLITDECFDVQYAQYTTFRLFFKNSEKPGELPTYEKVLTSWDEVPDIPAWNVSFITKASIVQQCIHNQYSFMHYFGRTLYKRTAFLRLHPMRVNNSWFMAVKHKSVFKTYKNWRCKLLACD